MKQLVKLLRRPLYRYLLVGGSVYLLELLIIYMTQRLGASSVVAVGLAFWIGLVVSFVLQKFVTFGDKRVHHKILLPQVVAVTLLVLFNFGFTLTVAAALSSTIPAALSRTLALGVTTIWNFYLYKTRIFKRSEELIY